MPEERLRRLLDELGIPQRSDRESFVRALAIADPLPRGRALDAPCGPGLMTSALVRLGFDAVGLDTDVAGHRAEAPFAAADLERGLPLASDRFRFVYCGDGIEHLENPFALLRELARVLTDDGLLVVVTPNYLNVERRLRFLFTGSLTRLPKRHPDFDPRSRVDRGHISPLTLTRLAYMAEYAGLELAHVETVGVKRRQRWLAPIAALIVAASRLRARSARPTPFADPGQRWPVVMGGRQLLATFHKAAGARAAATTGERS